MAVSASAWDQMSPHDKLDWFNTRQDRFDHDLDRAFTGLRILQDAYGGSPSLWITKPLLSANWVRSLGNCLRRRWLASSVEWRKITQRLNSRRHLGQLVE